MIIKKIVHGYVVQTFDTKKGKFTSQEFVAGDCDYEKKDGSPTFEYDNPESDAKFFAHPDGEPYLSFDMVQPK